VNCLFLTQNDKPQYGYELSIFILDVVHLLISIESINHKVCLFVLSDSLEFENKMGYVLLYQSKMIKKKESG